MKTSISRKPRTLCTRTPRVSALHAALSAALFTFPLLFAAAPAGAAQYTVTDLGGIYSSAYGINAAGQVVGYAYTSDNAPPHAFLWQSGSMQDLGTLGGTKSVAYSINAAGQVVGSATTSRNATSHAFLWQSGSMQDLGTLGGTFSYASGINATGQVAGAAEAFVEDVYNGVPYQSSAYHAFLWQSGSMQDLGTLGGGLVSQASGINDAGQVVGYSELSNDRTNQFAPYHAFLWQSGSMQDLGTLDGGTRSVAHSINAAGQVVGYATTSGVNASHAFLWQSGSMQDLGTLGGTESVAYSINAAGQVVGSADINGDGASHAFLWDSGSMIDLNSLIDPMPGWTINFASGINDSGQIVATGCDTDYYYCRAMLLTPVPEPETYLMMLAGLGLLAAKARRRNSAQ